MKRTWILVLALLPSACSSLPHHPVPRDLVDQAQVPGFPEVRFFGDQGGAVLDELALRTLARQRAWLAKEGHEGPLPPVDFLALSGGGSNGAFGAGLLNGWSERGDRPTFQVVTGISTGALIAPFAFLGPEWDAELERFYTTTSTKEGVGDLYQIYLDALRDHLEYRLAFIPESFERTPEQEFDPVYMRALFDLARGMAQKGYSWLEHPPGFDPSEQMSAESAGPS